MNLENFPLNVELFYLINHTRNPILDTFFGHFYLLGKGYILIPILVFVLLFQRERLWLFLTSLIIETLSVQFLKVYFSLPRPASTLTDVYLLEPLYHRSFPSGDTAMAFLLASFFSPVATGPLKILLWLYAFIIAYGRIYVGAHFPIDVLAGALIGIMSYYVAYKINRRISHVSL
ncbi:lipid A 1-phosphatase LpxE [Hydrogenobacter hydrogenophilus]|uniref:PAP2 superfamily protein n=1 Tax=Hydrogenobacter hydrogenophilus TaxID=35835 RepID=A0A285P129_9AQUI|nr:lipid A 1-phosphatase LpxE [Hydrogenobacter hydrogenophilus]SNZ15425.1 PAP2 superfamily protein [Hydrogenobacter hydrogenophilus]